MIATLSHEGEPLIVGPSSRLLAMHVGDRPQPARIGQNQDSHQAPGWPERER